MRKLRKFFVLFAFLLLLIVLPLSFAENIRGKAIALFAPLFKKTRLTHTSKETQEKLRLEGENHLLRLEIAKLKALLHQTTQVDIPVVAASVLYRDYSSSLWIDVGEETNRHLKKTVIAHNSPVIVGRSVVGAIDYVGEKVSRVRLLTDSGLKISVQVARAKELNVLLVEHIDALLCATCIKEEESLHKKLQEVKKRLCEKTQRCYFAKGILHGEKRENVLAGNGFHFEGEGPAIAESDLLITTGMDGVFPFGLPVATVTRVFPLDEGGVSYEIEAKSVVSHLDELRTVFILPQVLAE